MVRIKAGGIKDIQSKEKAKKVAQLLKEAAASLEIEIVLRSGASALVSRNLFADKK